MCIDVQAEVKVLLTCCLEKTIAPRFQTAIEADCFLVSVCVLGFSVGAEWRKTAGFGRIWRRQHVSGALSVWFSASFPWKMGFRGKNYYAKPPDSS
jgi:hypothetical protein